MNSKMLILAIGALVIIATSAFLLTKNSTNTIVPSVIPTPTTSVIQEATPIVSPSVTTKMTSTGTPSVSPSAATSKQVVKEFTVTGSPFKFVPATITVKKGDTVRVSFKNSGGIHNFVIDELGIKTKTIASGASDVVEFVAFKVGTFEYYCSVGTHRAQGMVGKITIE